MHTPVILLDVDGVLVNHQEENLQRLNEFFLTTYTLDSITSFDYKNLPPAHREYLISLWHETDYDHDALTEEQLRTIEGLRSFARVIACSSPLVGHADSKLAFLLNYFDRHDIILATDKALVSGEILIDDAPHQISAFPGHTIIYDQPWNRGISGPRAHSFDEIGPLVISYLMEQEDYDLS